MGFKLGQKIIDKLRPKPTRKYMNSVNIDDDNTPYTKAIRQIEENSFVLDVGCASGHVGNFLKKEKGCKVVGLDLMPEYIDYCKKLGCYEDLRLINLDKLNKELDDYCGKFDYILMLDVIEHVYSPLDVVKKLKKLLKKNGKMIFSIPNIAHGSIKLSIMQDKFRYRECGLLDNTHIRFFTLENVKKLFDNAKMKITNIEYVTQGIDLDIDEEIYTNASQVLIDEILKNPESLNYQFVVTVSV